MRDSVHGSRFYRRSRWSSFVRRFYEPFFRLSKAMSRKGLYPFLSEQFKATKPGHRVLSVGAAGEVNRLLESIAAEHGFEVVQLDIDSSLNPDIVADICTWSASEAFDVVVAAEVLEHCHHPRAALANLNESLRSGGRLILTVPFIFPIHDAPVDYFRYTRHGLDLLLGGFEDVVVSERNNWGETLAVLMARCVKPDSRTLKALSPIVVLIATLLYPLLWAVGELIPARFLTTGYNVTARKPL